MSRTASRVTIGLVFFSLLLQQGSMADDNTKPAGAKEMPFRDAVAVLKSSKDRDKLLQAALSLCRSANPEAIPALIGFLKKSSLSDRLLDPKGDYQKHDTRLEKIIMAIVKYSGPAAERRVDQVFYSGLYTGEPGLVWRRGRQAAHEPRDVLVRPIPFETAVAALEKSKDADYLLQAVVSLCRDKSPQAIASLLPFLKDSKFLKRLDSDTDYVRNHTRIQSVLWELARNSRDKAEERLLELADNKEYQEIGNAGERRLLLLKAAVWITRPSEKILSYLEKLMKPQTTELYLAMRALVEMRSPAATKLFEKFLFWPKFDAAAKMTWCEYFLAHREDLDILEIYRKLLNTKVADEEFRECIVLTLFSYDPGSWFPEDPNPPKPKPWSDVTSESLKEFLKLSELALKFGVSDDAKAKVAQARKEIEAVLTKRGSEKK